MPFSHVFIHVDKLLTQMSQDPDGKRQALEVWLAQFAKEAIISWSDHPGFLNIYSIADTRGNRNCSKWVICDNEQVKNSKVKQKFVRHLEFRQKRGHIISLNAWRWQTFCPSYSHKE